MRTQILNNQATRLLINAFSKGIAILDYVYIRTRTPYLYGLSLRSYQIISDLSGLLRRFVQLTPIFPIFIKVSATSLKQF